MKLQDLNSQQQEAVVKINIPLLVLAGAGSGKTRVVTNKIIHLVNDHNVDLDSILAITFTNKAANEMMSRVKEALGLEKDPKWITTFHSMCAKILRYEAHHVGYEKNFVIYDEKESEKLLKLILKAMKLDDDIYDASVIKNYISEVKQSLNELLLNHYELELPQFKTIFFVYMKALRASNAMDFDDLLCLTYKLFRTTPEVLDIWKRKFTYFLVDEYQDTNKAQHEIFKFLVGDSNNVTVVGDPQQTIYTWRGAHPDNILKFEEEFVGSDVVKLEQNYRSTKSILGAANIVISKATGAWKEKVLDLWTHNSEGEEVVVREFYDRGKESMHVASEISKLKTLKRLEWSDFAILVRMSFLTRQMEDALMRLRIPYQVIGGLKFSQRKEIRDMMSYISLIHNQKDEVAFDRIINVPSRGIGPAAVNIITEQDGDSYIDKLRSSLPKLSKKAAMEAEKLVRIFDFVLPKANDFPFDAISYIYNAVGYEKYLKDKFKAEAFDRISNVKELFAMLKTAQLNNKTLSTFLEESKLVSDQDDINSNNSVKIMTIHAAKGLEFPVVYLIGAEEGVLPCHLAHTQEEMEEERRLFYVAITRPKTILRISYATTEFGGNFNTKRLYPSRYINDIKDHVRII